MAQNNQDVLLRIKVDGDKAIAAVKEYTEKVNNLKEEQRDNLKAMQDIVEQQKSVNEAISKGTITAQEGAKVIGELGMQHDELVSKQIRLQAETKVASDTLRGYHRELQNTIKQEENNEGSLSGLRAELSNVTKAYDNLSRAEREGAQGKEMLDHINALTDEIKEAEEATQRYQRNVGNYKSALEGAEKAVGGLKDGVLGFVTGGNPFLEMLINTSQQLGSVKAAFGVAAQGAVMLGKQMLALLANPIVAFLAAVTAAFFALKKGIESSEERMNKFRAIVAPLQGIVDGFTKILGVCVDWLLRLADVTSDAIMWLSELAEALPVVGDSIRKGNEATREYIEIEKQKQDIQKKSRELLVTTAEREREVSDLRAKFAEKDKYSNKERLAFLEQAVAIEKKQAQDEKAMAELRYKNLQREAAMSDNDAAMNDKLAEAKAEVIRADKQLTDTLRELNGQRVEAINAIAAEEAAEKKAAEEKAKRWAEEARRNAEEQKTKEKDAIRAAEDAITAIITDNIAKRKAEIQKDYDRQIEDIKTRLATEKNLTVAAREALNTQIGALYIKQQQELNAVDAEVEEQRKAKLAEEEAAAKEARATAQQELIEERATQLQTELELIRSANMSELEEQQAMLEAKIAAKQEEIATMQQLEDESDSEFYLRKLEASNALTDLEEQHKDTNVRIAEEEAKKKREAYNSVMQAMTAMGEHSKALGKVAKIMGLAQIAVDTGKAISSGIASASALPFPANLAAIATTIATVVANMATAITSIKSAKFATGGLVTGAGSGTSDSIPAMLSNGESVMTAQATSAFAPLLSTLNQMGGGVPIQATSIGSQQMGEDMLARAVARGVAELQPVVSVEEINRVSANVRVIESLATI